MSENDSDSNAGAEKKKTLTLRGTGRSQGTVRQNFSHGRSKAVVVETRKRRISKPGDTPSAAEPKAPVVEAPEEEGADTAASGLSKSEVEARAKALEDAKVRAVEEAKQRELDEKRRAEEDVRREKEREEAAARKAEEDARLAAEREKAEQERRRRLRQRKYLIRLPKRPPLTLA